MYQRDFILDEARKFALILAKLMGLKLEGKHEEYTKAFDDAMQQEYNTDAAKLMALNTNEFADYIKQQQYSTEKLNALASLLYMYAEPFNADDETVDLLNKVITIFDLLQEQHRYESFENMDKRNTIYRFFNNNYGRTKVESTSL